MRAVSGHGTRTRSKRCRGSRWAATSRSPSWSATRASGRAQGNLADRLAEAQTGNPFPPRVILWTGPGLTLEQALHARFEVYRLRGERFEFPADQDSVVAVVQAVQELADGA